MATLALSSTFASTARPLSSAALPADAYVVGLAALQSHYAALTTSPPDLSAIRILDADQGGSAPVRILPGHERGTSSICTTPELAGGRDVLLSCGKDGTVNAWDVRADGVVPSFKSELAQCMRA